MRQIPLILLKNVLYHFVCRRDEPRYFALKARMMLAAAQAGAYESEYLALLPFFIRPGSDVVDVGANFGAYTVVMSRLVGSKGRVFAFEPLPPAADILSRSCAALANVVVVREALSGGETDALDLRVPFLAGGVPEPALAAADPAPWAGTLKTWKVYRVPVRRLDDHSAEFRDISFIKVDVEGHEAAFLSGATETIQRFRPVLQLESSGVRRHAAAVQEWMHGARYVLLTGRERRLKLSSIGAARGLNLYLVPEEAVGGLPAALLQRAGGTR
jgi:FkbM family methyltransferase